MVLVNQFITAMNNEEKVHQIALKEKFTKRLRVLELQEADFGNYCPPHIITEMNELRETIERIDKDLAHKENRSNKQKDDRDAAQKNKVVDVDADNDYYYSQPVFVDVSQVEMASWIRNMNTEGQMHSVSGEVYIDKFVHWTSTIKSIEINALGAKIICEDRGITIFTTFKLDEFRKRISTSALNAGEKVSFTGRISAISHQGEGRTRIHLVDCRFTNAQIGGDLPSGAESPDPNNAESPKSTREQSFLQKLIQGLQKMIRNIW